MGPPVANAIFRTPQTELSLNNMDKWGYALAAILASLFSSSVLVSPQSSLEFTLPYISFQEPMTNFFQGRVVSSTR